MKYNIYVNPNSRQVDVSRIDEISYRVKVDAPPEKGEANRRLVEILSEYFSVPKSNVIIKAGERSKVKIVEIIK